MAVLLVISTPPVWAESAKALIKEAEAAWQRRDKPLQTEAAIVLWERALRLAPERTELYIPLTRASGRAYRQSKDPGERKYWSEEARSYGALAAEKNPSRPEALALYGEALGQWAQSHKGPKSLAAVRQAVKNLEKAVSLSPRYAFAHMLLAQFYEKSPGWISVGNRKKALEHAERAVEYGPDSAIHHNTLAEIYKARGRKVEALKELENTLALKPPKDAVPETRADQDNARDMLKGL